MLEKKDSYVLVEEDTHGIDIVHESENNNQ